MDSIFEENKKNLLDRINAMRQTGDKVSNSDNVENTTQSAAEICIYGIKSTFIDILIDTMKKQFNMEFFDNAEEAFGFCIDNKVKIVLLDMDPPTDWKISTDVFTTIKTAKPGMHFILMTKSPHTTPVETLAALSADILIKPFGIDVLFKNLKNKLLS